MKVILAIGCFLLSWSCCFASYVAISSEAIYCVDTNSSLDFAQLKTNNWRHFKQNEIVKIGFNSNATVWIKLSLHNKTNRKQSFFVSFPNIHIDSLTIFSKQRSKLLGDRTNSRGKYAVAHVFPVTLQPSQSGVVWVKVKKIISFLDFKYELVSKQHLDSKNIRSLIFTTIFIGLITMLILLNLILFFITKSAIYFSYVLYSLLTIIYLTITTGFAKFYVIPNCIWVSEIRVYSGSFWIILLLFFYKELLQTKTYYPKLNNLINGLSWFNIAHMAFVFFLPKIEYFSLVQFFWKLGYLVFLIQGVLILYVTVKVFKKNKKISLYICLSFVPHLLWFITYILRSFQVIMHEVNYEWLLIIALYEAVLFGFILAYNYVSTFRHNNELNLKVIALKQESIEMISKTQIKERRQIANVIHDKFGSQLAYIKNLMDTQKATVAKEKIHQLAVDIRNISHQILPKALDDGALSSSIENQIAILNESVVGCEIIFQTFDFPVLIQEAWRFDVYLISLELINNALKHAQPTEIVIEFYHYDDKFVFQYTDNGCGFDVTNSDFGFGLTSIQSRIQNVKGSVEINSQVGEGTVIQLII